jgi:hypothetical protein
MQIKNTKSIKMHSIQVSQYNTILDSIKLIKSILIN